MCETKTRGRGEYIYNTSILQYATTHTIYCNTLLHTPMCVKRRLVKEVSGTITCMKALEDRNWERNELFGMSLLTTACGVVW